MKLKTAKKEQWISVTRGGETAEFLVQPISAEESFGLVEKATTTKYKRGVKDEKINLFQLKVSRIIRVIKDWKGIEDEDGNPVPFTTENLIIAYNFNQDIIDEALDKVDEIAEAEEQKAQEELKNF